MILETVYYSLFIKYSKKEGKFLRYFINFILISIIGVLIGRTSLLSYLFLIMMIVSGLKYIVKVKVTNFDILYVLLMMIFKIIIEGVSVTIISNFIKDNYVMATLLGIEKIIILFLFKNKLNLLYNKFEKYWNNNVFYIRYAFTIVMLIYVIISCGFLIFN